VDRNAQTYLDQARKILDFDRLEVHRNRTWLGSLDLKQITELLSTMTLQQMLAKEGFRERYDNQQPVYLHEFLYPLMQGYDSVEVRADLELGGTDQKFNLAVGRDLQVHFGQKPQLGVLVPLLVGLDGTKKMSKSIGNYVGLTDDPLTMYTKLEKVPDALIETYFTLLTPEPADPAANPRARQRQLALTITSQLHSPAAAQQAQQDALKLFQGQTDQADQVPEFSLGSVVFPATLAQILKATGLVPSTSEGIRQIRSGGVRLQGEKIADEKLAFTTAESIVGTILQVGKKKAVRLIR